MRTIFITGFHPLVFRNILTTPIIDALRTAGYRIVIFVPDYRRSYIETILSGNNIVIEGVGIGSPTPPRTFIRRLLGRFSFVRMAHAMLGTDSMRIAYRGRLRDHGRFFHYFFFYLPLRIAGRFRCARAFFRALNFRVAPDERFAHFFEQYTPDLVFSTDVTEKYDVDCMMSARRRKIPVVSMVRSFDNLTKLGILRIIPDRLLVWSEPIRDEAVRYHDVPTNRIDVVGIPHYDRYTHGIGKSREAFFESIGADPKKKLIFFSPIGAPRLRHMDSDRYILDILARRDATILVRLPPTNPVDLGSFLPALPAPKKGDNKPVFGKGFFSSPASPNIIFDHPGVIFLQNDWLIDSLISDEDDKRLIEALRNCDLVVGGPSTIAVDASVFDKPTILFNFSQHNEPLLEPTMESYNANHMQYILQSGGVRLVGTEKEFEYWIDTYLQHPETDREGRMLLAKNQCWKLDGKASERVVSVLKHILQSNKCENSSKNF